MNAPNNAIAPRRASLKRAILNHLKLNKMESAKWLLRFMISLCGIAILFPWIVNSQSCFKMVLFLNTAVCLLRLIQRLNDNTLTADFISNPFGEDAMQYILYSWIFYGITPCVMFVAVLPVILYNALVVSTYTHVFLVVNQCRDRLGICDILSCVPAHGVRLYRLVAFLEIFLMCAVMLMSLHSVTTMLVPCAYSYFLTCRYYSRRNPFSRIMFAEMRRTIDSIIEWFHDVFAR